MAWFVTSGTTEPSTHAFRSLRRPRPRARSGGGPKSLARYGGLAATPPGRGEDGPPCRDGAGGPQAMNPEQFYKRIAGIFAPERLWGKKVVVVGLGSGGCRVAAELGRLG